MMTEQDRSLLQSLLNAGENIVYQTRLVELKIVRLESVDEEWKAISKCGLSVSLNMVYLSNFKIVRYHTIGART